MNKCSADVARRAAEEITLQTGKGHSLSLWHTHKFFDVLNSCAVLLHIMFGLGADNLLVCRIRPLVP